MVVWAVAINSLVALFNFYLAWKLWTLRPAIAKASEVLAIAERKTHKVLNRAPQFMTYGKTGTHSLRARYWHLQVQLQHLQQILSLLALLSQLQPWIGRSRPSPFLTNPKDAAKRPQARDEECL